MVIGKLISSASNYKIKPIGYFINKNLKDHLHINDRIEYITFREGSFSARRTGRIVKVYSEFVMVECEHESSFVIEEGVNRANIIRCI